MTTHSPDRHDTGTGSRPAYLVVATWKRDRGEWSLAVIDRALGTNVGSTKTRRLEQADRRARALLAQTGQLSTSDVVDIAVQVEVDEPEQEIRLHLAENLIDDASSQLDQAVTWLQRSGLSLLDIDTILSRRALTARPRRPLTIPNSEIVAGGLHSRPDVTAVIYEDLGYGVTTYCRNCVHSDTTPWKELPHAKSGLLYDNPVNCAACIPATQETTTIDECGPPTDPWHGTPNQKAR